MEDEDIVSDDESTSSSQIRQDFSQILDEFLDKYEISGRKIVQKLEGDDAQDQLEIIRQGLKGINISNKLNKNNNEENIKLKYDKRNVKGEEDDKGIETEDDEKDQIGG